MPSHWKLILRPASSVWTWTSPAAGVAGKFMDMAAGCQLAPQKENRRFAAELDARKILTPTGMSWHAETVLRVQRRLED
jgi:hypothetical protein